MIHPRKRNNKNDQEIATRRGEKKVTNSEMQHSLGGSTGPTSPEDVRKRRLAALQGSSSSLASSSGMKEDDDAGVPPTSPPSSPTRYPPMLRFSSPAAAATMTMSHNDTTTTTSTTTTRGPADDGAAAAGGWDLTAFQAIMWDASVTTEQDQERWINQGIGMRMTTTNADEIIAPATAAAAAAAAAELLRPSSGSTSAETRRLEELVNMPSIPWGLMQQHGGPCGVLAAVQAELLRHLWRYDDHDIDDSSTLLSPEIALAKAMAEILVRVATTPPANDNNNINNNSPTEEKNVALASSSAPYPVVRIIIPNPNNPSWKLLLLSNSSDVVNVQIFGRGRDGATGAGVDHDSSSTAAAAAAAATAWQDAIEAFVLQHLPVFADVGGVLLFVMSIVATRSAALITHEFDDAVGTKLTAQFGHCAQELINLLLTGQAVSNVFDNTLSPSGDMVCRGIQMRPQIGYLSQLEALRYCEVGSYYKSPKVPIWVVGSTSHFTVLFGESAALAESQSDLILEECRRAFKSMEGGEENGYIHVRQLGEIFGKLKIDLGSDADAKTQTLASSMEVGGGAGIILWDDFWKAAGRLMTGATVENILGAGTSVDPINIDDLTCTAIVPSHNHPPAGMVESDEEMARRLNAEWSSNDIGLSGLNALSSAAAVVASSNNDNDSTMQVESSGSPVAMSDEEYARVLQAEYDSHDFPSNGSVGAVRGDTTTVADDDELSDTAAADDNDASNIEVDNAFLFGDQNAVGADGRQTPMNMEIDGDLGDTKPAARQPRQQQQRAHSFEEFGESFSLYHYNGLRGGVLTRFKVTRLSSQEAIGSSVALNRGGAAGGGSSSGQDLEDVVRTKWPSCNVDWLGGRAPFID
jgi:Domain of unknown function (DUF4205)